MDIRLKRPKPCCRSQTKYLLLNRKSFCTVFISLFCLHVCFLYPDFFQGKLLSFFRFTNSKYLFSSAVIFFKSNHVSLSPSNVSYIMLAQICDFPILSMFRQNKETAKWINKANFTNNINK